MTHFLMKKGMRQVMLPITVVAASIVRDGLPHFSCFHIKTHIFGASREKNIAPVAPRCVFAMQVGCFYLGENPFAESLYAICSSSVRPHAAIVRVN